ncbi:MAG: zinc-dependent metalloprotease, partial [Actinobacteria bacterium]|nr:zinc-dependent metalloprotease [Actinomycetota bacterium]
MSDPPQPGLPFGFGNFDISEVFRLLQSEGPLNVEVAQQVATWVANQGEAEPPTDAAEADVMAELTRTAQMHVHQATELGGSITLGARTRGRTEWAHDVLDGLTPSLTA